MKNRIPQERGKPRTYVIRGQEVMLDRDLAKFYGVSLGVLKVKTNSIVKARLFSIVTMPCHPLPF